MQLEREIIIKNKSGLHARPAAMFVQIANKFESNITVSKGRQKVNGKSIMGILMLAASKGAKVVISANGLDAEQAVEELSQVLLEDADYGFGGKITKK